MAGRKFFWRLHHWVGLYTGILIGILSITGAAAVFIPEIDALIVKHHYHSVSSPSPTGRPQFSRSVDSLTKRYPEYRSLSLFLPQQPGQALKADLILDAPTGGIQRYDFFIDSGTDRILGQRNHQNALANYLRQIHVRLYDGYWGRQLVGIGGLALAVVAITGLLIYANFMRRQTWPTIRKTAKARILMADWHKLLGISALAFNLVIALTGAWLGLQPWLMRWFDITTPNAYAPPIEMTAAADKALPVNWDAVWDATQDAFPELQPSHIVPSANGSGTILVRGDVPGLVYERAANTVVLSKTDYTPLFKYDIRAQPFSHKLYFVQEALHFGDFGGLTLKILYAILGLTSGFLSISGFVVYLCRRQNARKPTASPLKITFVYSMLVFLFLIGIAFISLFIGYAQAAFTAAIIINTLLMGLVGYGLIRYALRRYQRNNPSGR